GPRRGGVHPRRAQPGGGRDLPDSRERAAAAAAAGPALRRVGQGPRDGSALQERHAQREGDCLPAPAGGHEVEEPEGGHSGVGGQGGSGHAEVLTREESSRKDAKRSAELLDLNWLRRLFAPLRELSSFNPKESPWPPKSIGSTTANPEWAA